MLRYDSDTGDFVWLTQKSNCIMVGSKAGCLRKTGYIEISLDGRLYFAHRLAWLYNFNNFPKEQIDHINGNRSDNRLANLREVSRAENMRNIKMQSNNTSGLTGVNYREVPYRCGSTNNYWTATWYDTIGKYRSKSFAVSKYGYDKSKELAVSYRAERIQELNTLGAGYTDRHGL